MARILEYSQTIFPDSWVRRSNMSSHAVIASRVCCPACKSVLRDEDDGLGCENPTCGAHYSVVDGVPDLLGPNLEKHVETDFFPHKLRNGPVSDVTRSDFQFAFLHDRLSNAMSIRGRNLDVLDVGCGTRLSSGDTAQDRHLEILRDTCRSYSGLDPSWQVMQSVNASGSIIGQLPEAMLVRGVGEFLPFPSESFDAALVLSVLDHCVSPGDVLEEIRRVLRPGGLVILSLGKRDAWYFRGTRPYPAILRAEAR